MLPFALPAFTDNYLWMLPCAGGMAVVDPGDAAVVLRQLAQQHLKLQAILITHHHHDHIGGVAQLVAQFPDVRVIGPRDARIGGLTEVVAGGAVVDLGATWHFKVVATPGHTRTHIAYHDERHLFCGDTLFSLGCGRLFEGTPAQMHDSLTRIAVLSADTAVYCTHEYTLANARFALTVDPSNVDLQQRVRAAQAQRDQGLPTLPTTLGEERACNPFLRVDDPDIVAAVSAHAGRALTTAVEVFAALRAWKDGFA